MHRFVLALLTFSLAPAVPAQHVTLLGGLALPTGPFSEEGLGLFGTGGAQPGFAASAEVSVPLNATFFALASASLSVNPLSGGAPPSEVEFETGHYLNVPLTAGLGVRLPYSSSLVAEGFVQGGVNYSRRPEMVILQPPGSAWEPVTDPASSDVTPAFVVGMQVVLADRFLVSPRYLHLGSASFTTEAIVIPPSGLPDQPVSMIQVLLGARF